eukprot:m.124209 g.124209  ORF g.124209 m.124209 type:complete len:84 (-) comp11149_c0_seq1:681-932(-)
MFLSVSMFCHVISNLLHHVYVLYECCCCERACVTVGSNVAPTPVMQAAGHATHRTPTLPTLPSVQAAPARVPWTHQATRYQSR